MPRSNPSRPAPESARSRGVAERTVGLFLLGLVLFFPPVLTVFDRAALLFGIPVLFLYLFGAWALLIGLIAWVMERGGGPPDEGG